MKYMQGEIIKLTLILSLLLSVKCTELTFELEDNAKQCFHEVIKKDTKCTLEFQVIFKAGILLIVDNYSIYLLDAELHA